MPITGAPPAVPVAVRVYRSDNQVIPDATWTTMIFDTQRWDDPNDDQWEGVTNPARLTCQFDGPYVVSAHVRWDLAAGDRLVDIYLNGTTVIVRSQLVATASFSHAQFASTPYKLVVGDFLEVQVYQNSGAPLIIGSVGNYSPEFTMVRCV